MFRKKKACDVAVDFARYLGAVICAAQETLTRGGCLLEDPDNERRLDDVLAVGPEIVCANAGLPAEVIAWVRREATYRTAVAYAGHRDRPIGCGDDAVIDAVIEEVSGQPLEVQAGVLAMAAVFP